MWGTSSGSWMSGKYRMGSERPQGRCHQGRHGNRDSAVALSGPQRVVAMLLIKGAWPGTQVASSAKQRCWMVTSSGSNVQGQAVPAS